MTELEWESFARLYREVWKAHADLASLRTMLTMAEFAGQQNRLEMAAKAIAGWEARLERSRSKNFYAKYLNKCEQHISQAEAQRADAALMESFEDDPPPRIGSSELT